MIRLSYALILGAAVMLQMAIAQQFQIPIHVSDGNAERTVWLGLHPNGTDGFDPMLDTLAPPPPPSGIFDAQFVWQNQGYFTDIRDNSPSLKMFVLLYQLGSGPVITLRWDAALLAGLADFTITDNITGTLFSLDMTSTDSLVANPFIQDGLRILIENPVTGIDDRPVPVPFTAGLGQNYPNPFNPATVIPFRLEQSAHVRISVYNILGQKIAVLADSPFGPGEHQLQFDGSGLPAGLYLYRMETASSAFTRKMLLIP